MTTASEGQPQQYTFQAEIKQLLHLLSHSLYQSREIAIRELISNASDALDKMRYVALTDPSRRDDKPLEIRLEGRKDAKELILADNGVGMTRDELVTNLGTIAHSGSREFLRGLAASEQKEKADLSLIGQFGVGFYSAFMLADKVRVRTRSYLAETGWEWESDGSGTFTITEVADLPRGTEIVLHLKGDADEFADDWRLKSVVRKYSGFVPHPVRIGGEVVNDQKPIWVEPKSQITSEQYEQFYQHLTHHTSEKPLWHIHLSVDSPIQFHALLYCPPTNFEKIGFGRIDHGLSLCARRILVQSDNRELLPEYLRFLYGIVDSEDLPLNVSRETLQDSSVFRKIRGALIKATIDRLTKLADEDAAAYAHFYEQFGITLKEGIANDFDNRQKLAKLLRFASSTDESPASVSLDAYVNRSLPDQRRIYYYGGPDLASVKKSPNLEVFRKKGVEVLFLIDPVDEFVMSSLGSYDGRTLTSIDSDDLGLPGGEIEVTSTPEADVAGLGRVLELFREALVSRVKEVRASKRLTDSPCCLVNADGSMTTQMQRLLKMANRDIPEQSRYFEVNPDAPLIRRFAALSANPANDEFVRQSALQLWANALILEGTLPEPEAMVARLQTLLEQAAEARPTIVT